MGEVQEKLLLLLRDHIQIRRAINFFPGSVTDAIDDSIWNLSFYEVA
jgi:hypothetical protein